MFSGPLEKNSNPSLHNPWDEQTKIRHQESGYIGLLVRQTKIQKIMFSSVNIENILKYLTIIDFRGQPEVPGRCEELT